MSKTRLPSNFKIISNEIFFFLNSSIKSNQFKAGHLIQVRVKEHVFVNFNYFTFFDLCSFLELMNLKCTEWGKYLCLFSALLIEEAGCPCFNLLSLLKSFWLISPMEI